MPFFYDLATGAYHLSIKLAAPFVTKARKWVQGRIKVWARLEQRATDLQGCFWMHCSSLGEFEQGRPVLEAMRDAHPDLPILLTFYSPSGYEVRKDYPLATHVEYLPADGASNAQRLIHIVRPCMAVFVKYEFWYHYLEQLKRKEVPTFLISAIFRKEQPFFRPWGGTHRSMLQCFDHLFVQDEASSALLHGIGIEGVSVAGDTRFDRVWDLTTEVKEMPLAKAFKRASERPILVCGSTWPTDEKILIEAIDGLGQFPRMLIAPHEISDDHIRALVAQLPLPVDRWSHLQDMLKGLFNPPDSGLPQPPDLPNGDPLELNSLVVDRIGLLSQLYRYGDIAYVGGGFGKGIHNLLEAAVWGIPVIFGPKHQKFAEAQGLIASGGGFEVNSATEMYSLLHRMSKDAPFRMNAGTAAKAYVNAKRGATQQIMRRLLTDLR